MLKIIRVGLVKSPSKEEIGKVTRPSPKHSATLPSWLYVIRPYLHEASTFSGYTREYRLKTKNKDRAQICNNGKAAVFTG